MAFFETCPGDDTDQETTTNDGVSLFLNILCVRRQKRPLIFFNDHVSEAQSIN